MTKNIHEETLEVLKEMRNNAIITLRYVFGIFVCILILTEHLALGFVEQMRDIVLRLF